MRFNLLLILLILFGSQSLAAHAAAVAPVTGSKGAQTLTTELNGETVVIDADRLTIKQNESMEAQGNVEVRQGKQKINADYLLYQQETRDVLATGSVRIEQPGGVMMGPRLQMNLDSNIGEMETPAYTISGTPAHGNADMMFRTGPTDYYFDHSSFTTCPAESNDWLLKMVRLDLDRKAEIGTAHHAYVEFMGVPILYTPWMDFPLNDSRKSGFLGPIIGSTSLGGSEITVPLYLNIAPNYDATLAPRVMSKRGVMLNNEFRYLGSSYRGDFNYDVLPDDKIVNQTRTRVALKHVQSLGYGFSAGVQLNRVSDDSYFRDLASAVSGTAQVNLLNEGLLTYSGGWWTATARAQQFQTLQDPAAPIVEPYRRLPQVNITAQKILGSGTFTEFIEYVDFRHPTLVNGQRTVVYPTFSYPLIRDMAYYVTPKIGLHNTRYLLGDNNTGTIVEASRTLPIFSVDSGLILERDFKALGVDYVQTLEPRAYYVNIPYQDQSTLPVFDSAQAPFNYAQMFTENRFIGNDRVGDANMATVAVTSRFFEAEGGSERLRFGLGERFSFINPQVNLVAPTGVTNRSDILLTVGGRLTRSFDLDSLYQYNPNESRAEAFNAVARYHPEKGKVFNLGYRYTREVLEIADASTQWPLFKRWNAVGRWSYSVKDNLALERLGGLEYNQDCWTFRVVVQLFTTATNVKSRGMFVQLELNDLVRVGADPLSALKLSIPGYTKTNESSFDKPTPGLR
jgi:LPS-assembly protein